MTVVVLTLALLLLLKSVRAALVRHVALKKNRMDGMGQQKLGLSNFLLLLFPGALRDGSNLVSRGRNQEPPMAAPDSHGRKIQRRRGSTFFDERMEREIESKNGLFGDYWTLDVSLFACWSLTVAMSNLPPGIFDTLDKIGTSLLMMRIALPLIGSTHIMLHYVMKEQKDPLNTDWSYLSEIICWISRAVLGVCVAQLYGINTSALVTGLGVGGITIGFALQTTLKNVFAWFAIIIDQPFKVGDYVNVGSGNVWAPDGGYSGHVEKLGVRSTEIRMLNSGQVLHVPNELLANGRIVNQSQMAERRHEICLVLKHPEGGGVNSREALKELPALLSEIVRRQEPVAKLQSSHLLEILPQGLKYQTVFHVEGNDSEMWKTVTKRLTLVSWTFSMRKIFKLLGRGSMAGPSDEGGSLVSFVLLICKDRKNKSVKVTQKN